MKVCPATVKLPERLLVLVFALAEKVTVPLPAAVETEAMDSHEELLDALQPQPLGAVTETLPEPPPEPTDPLPEESE